MPGLDPLQARATERYGWSVCKLRAALGRGLTEPGLDGRRWECVVTDGSRFETIEVTAPRLEHDQPVDPVDIEEEVERFACNCTQVRRLAEVVGLSPIAFPDLFLGGAA